MDRISCVFLCFSAKVYCFTSIWVPVGGGAWNNGANWNTNPLFPNGIDDAADIHQNIAATTPISLGQNITIGALSVGDTAGLSSYQIGNGANTLTFQASSGTALWTNSGGSFNNIISDVILASSLLFQGTSSGVITAGISGPGSLIVDDSGVGILLIGVNTYTGGTFINEGAISIGLDGAIPAGSTATIGTGLGPPSSAAVATGSTIMTPANAFFANILSDGALVMATGSAHGVCISGVSGTGTIDFILTVNSFLNVTGASGDSTFNGNMTGGIASSSTNSTTGQRFIKSGSNRLTFATPLNYLGRIFVQGGTLAAQNDTSLGAAGSSAAFVLSGATLELQNNIAINKPISLNGGGVSGVGALFNASGSNTLATSPLTLGWSDVPSGVVASNPTLNVASGTQLTIASTVQGASDWTKTGGGTLILSGANSYTGSTTVAEGTLLVQGSTGNVPIGVSAGAVLGGTGTVGAGGAAVVNDGTVSPGASIGTLVIAGNYSQGAGGKFLEEVLNPSSFDLLIVNGGGVSLNGNLTVEFLPGYSVQPGDQFLFIDNTGGIGVSGTFATLSTINVPSDLTPTLIYNSNSVLLQFDLNTQALFPAQTANLSLPFLATVDQRIFALTRKLSYARRRIQPYGSNPASQFVAQSNFPDGISAPCSSPQHPVILFADALGTIGTVYKTSTQNPFGYSSAGLLLGAGYTFRRGVLGIAVDGEMLKGNMSERAGDFRETLWNASLFGTLLPICSSNLYLNWVAGSGMQYYKLRRNTEEGSVSGNPNGWDAFGYSEIGYPFQGAFGTLTPLAGLEYVYLFIQNYREQGSSAFSLSIDSENIQSLRSVIGASWDFTKTHGLELRGLWLREYLNDIRQFEFASIPFGAASAVQVLSPSRNIGIIGGIIRFCFNRWVHAEASYDFEWSSSFHTHLLYGGIEGRF